MVNIKEFNFLMAKPEYEDQMKTLWAQCFPEDAHGFVDFYFDHCYQSKSAYLAVRQGKVCAMAYAPLMKYHMWGVNFTVPYIQGVATAPEFRRLGLANALLHHALNHLHNQGVPFGILKPFRVDFYEKSGWRVFAGLAEVTFDGDNRREFAEKFVAGQRSGIFRQICPYNNEESDVVAADLHCRRVADIVDIDGVDLPGLTAIFESWQQAHRNNYPLRGTTDWRLLLMDHFNDGGEIWLVEHDGKSLAYALLMANEEEIFIRELAAVGRISLEFLLRQLQEKLPSAKKLRLNLPANQCLADDFRPIPFAMLRVINAETLFSASRWGLEAGEERNFSIHDPIIANNNGIFSLSEHDGGSCCHKIDENTDFAKKIPEIDVNLLTGLLFKWYNGIIEVKNQGESQMSPWYEIDGSYFNEYFR